MSRLRSGLALAAALLLFKPQFSWTLKVGARAATERSVAPLVIIRQMAETEPHPETATPAAASGATAGATAGRSSSDSRAPGELDHHAGVSLLSVPGVDRGPSQAETVGTTMIGRTDAIIGSQLTFFILFFFFIGVVLAWLTWWAIRVIWRPEEGDEDAIKENSTFVCGMGSFTIQYNLVNTYMATAIMNSEEYPSHGPSAPLWMELALMMWVFAGMIIGMVVAGLLGDTIGRVSAIRLSFATTVLGGLLPTVAVGSDEFVWMTVMTARLLIGLGVGGLVPLVAVYAAESHQERQEEHLESCAIRVAKVYFWQTPGSMAPYACAAALLMLPDAVFESREETARFSSRALLVSGAFPALLGLWTSFKLVEPRDFEAQRRGGLKVLQKHFKELLGVGANWFLYDAVYYGSVLAVPLIARKIYFADASVTLTFTALFCLVSAAMGIPGVVFSIAAIRPFGTKGLNASGFLLLALSWAGVVVALRQEDNDALWWMHGMVLLFLSFGPNVGTYVQPSLTFATNVRGTFCGLSAMIGKFMCKTMKIFCQGVRHIFQRLVEISGRVVDGKWTIKLKTFLSNAGCRMCTLINAFLGQLVFLPHGAGGPRLNRFTQDPSWIRRGQTGGVQATAAIKLVKGVPLGGGKWLL